MDKYQVIIIGAGAAGLMCAIEAGKRHRRVLVLDHANKPGKKILLSGGGRCNFTNLDVSAENFISHNPHFCKSALSRYTPQQFIDLVREYKIPFHEKTLGQLFCDHKSKDILELLLAECEKNDVFTKLNNTVTKITKTSAGRFKINTNQGIYSSDSLVVATGGLSFPTMGASPFGYKIAKQFEIKTWPLRAGLVPLTLHNVDKERFAALSGVSAVCIAENALQSFRENLLFTHRGLSGPAILQISSYWQPGEALRINLLPDIDLASELQSAIENRPNVLLKTLLTKYLPKSVIQTFLTKSLTQLEASALTPTHYEQLQAIFQDWQLKPNGTEGYRTAEVTLGGVDCNAISSKTMECLKVQGLYFIGEVLDVTGWLGGYNFQWAWSSGWAAGQVA